VEWSPRAVTTASRFLDDADSMHAVIEGLDALPGIRIRRSRSGGQTCCDCAWAGTGSCTSSKAI